MQIIHIDSNYTDFLYKADKRVSKNINVIYQRPYVGVLLNVEDKQYFAPLTTSRKRKKLRDNPMSENVTFMPIDECRLGGINFNNMIPVVKDVFWAVDMDIKETDNEWEKKRKIMFRKTVRFLRKHKDHIILKAKYLYNLSIKNKLSPKQKVIVCDFKLLEKAASKYKK